MGMNQGNWGALISGGVQGAQTEQSMEAADLKNKYTRAAMVDPAMMEDQALGENYNEGVNSHNKQGGTQWSNFTAAPRLFDPARQGVHDVWAKAKAFLGGKQSPAPVAQNTTPQASNMAASAPQPTSVGSTGDGPAPDQYYANGGIPGRGGMGMKPRKAKPGNKAVPSKAARAVMPKPPQPEQADPMGMGAEEPPFADGGAPAPEPDYKQGLINTARDDARVDASNRHAWDKDPTEYNKEVAGDQKMSDRLSSPNHRLPVKTTAPATQQRAPAVPDGKNDFANGGGIPSRLLKQDPATLTKEPKPNGKSVKQDVSNFGEQGRFARTIKKFADGGQDSPAYDQDSQPAPGLEGATPAPETNIEHLHSTVNKGIAKVMDLAPWTTMQRGMEGAEAIPGRLAAWGSSPYKPEPPDSPPAPTAAQQGPPKSPPPGNPAAASEGPPKPATPNPGSVSISASQSTHGGGGGGHAAAGPHPAEMGQPPIDFSQVNVNHREIPDTSAQDWKQMQDSIVHMAIAKGVPVGTAQMQAQQQITQYQHANFMQYLQQGAALDAAGNKDGAMAAYKTAYNYMPTGHAMDFGVTTAPQKRSDGSVVPVGTIVGYGRDEDTHKPVGVPVLLDQASINHLASTFQDPKNWQAENLALTEQRRKGDETYKGQIPLARAQAGLAGAEAGYYTGKNAELEDVARMRLEARNAAQHMPPDVSLKVNGALRTSGIMDPDDLFAATGVAAQLMQKGHSQADATSIAGMMYAPGVDPQRRAAFGKQYGIETPDSSPMPGQGYGGIPPR